MRLCVYNEFWDPIESYPAGPEVIPERAPFTARDFFRDHPEADTYFSGPAGSADRYDFYARVRINPSSTPRPWMPVSSCST